MNEDSPEPEPVPTFDIQRWLGDVVHRCILQVGAMQAVEEKMKKVARRSEVMNPPATSDELRNR